MVRRIIQSIFYSKIFQKIFENELTITYYDGYNDALDKMQPDPYEGYTIEDQARDLQITVEEAKDFNKSNLSWLEWCREQGKI